MGTGPQLRRSRAGSQRETAVVTAVLSTAAVWSQKTRKKHQHGGGEYVGCRRSTASKKVTCLVLLQHPLNMVDVLSVVAETKVHGERELEQRHEVEPASPADLTPLPAWC